jgi:Ca2+-binding RTX toxin-like protein
VRGGEGRDIASLDPGDDFLGGGSESDLVDTFSTVPLVVDMKAGRAFGLGHDRLAGWEDATFDVRASITLIGSDGANQLAVIVGLVSVPVVIHGRGGNDQLEGSELADHLHGGRGDDTIAALGGDDIVDGGAGTDTLMGGPGTDRCTRGEVLTSCP